MVVYHTPWVTLTLVWLLAMPFQPVATMRGDSLTLAVFDWQETPAGGDNIYTPEDGLSMVAQVSWTSRPERNERTGTIHYGFERWSDLATPRTIDNHNNYLAIYPPPYPPTNEGRLSSDGFLPMAHQPHRATSGGATVEVAVEA
ncbi:hypothetical protein H4R33_006240 [Dimargaris cristalligena]|uniref:Uncharacterized protein n=1 Tax=Dimargaris cristalligena TaxID=215637 RepID=A0A4P9ZPC4_9FUNG|nr:hypothetical protein H4R33_006240 [Dimargaris cristalligena]RKP35048.1 hypothetical protein BJ085DRAFT_27710 [Dimargaris cristalligena]|eukprot:RKP35048.1 hypothetical protein BJ085DRAFT_27710 [Dimargaris cristalligena]